MAPLIEGMSRDEVKWAKFKNSYMYNRTYYLRRTKFVVYQLATTTVGICSALASATIHKYNHKRSETLDAFPDVDVNTKGIIAIMGMTIAASGMVGLVFTLAVFYDLFWPERREVRSVQLTWKLGALLSSTLQLAASIAAVVVVAREHVDIRSRGTTQELLAIEFWGENTFYYRKNGLILATVVLIWLATAFTIWSTIVMWMCYSHNNKYGPFNAHQIRDSGSDQALEEISPSERVVWSAKAKTTRWMWRIVGVRYD